jgi:hypothetical protein
VIQQYLHDVHGKHLSVPQANGQAIVKGLANGQAIEERIS